MLDGGTFDWLMRVHPPIGVSERIPLEETVAVPSVCLALLYQKVARVCLPRWRKRN